MKICLVFLLISACIVLSANAQPQPEIRPIPLPVPVPKPVRNCACGDRVCVKTVLDRVRGVVAATVKNLIMLIESEHLPRPPPCTGPARPCAGIKLPDTSKIFESVGCTCDRKH